MTQQQIQERNQQIALMLGGIYSKLVDAWGLGNAQNIGSKMFDGVMYEDVIKAQRFEKELKFHSDWNWLMEAIQFLQKHFESKERSWTTIDRYPLYTDIETVFVIVSDFAKHYNEGKL
jgi:hypothetical protein